MSVGRRSPPGPGWEWGARTPTPDPCRRDTPSAFRGRGRAPWSVLFPAARPTGAAMLTTHPPTTGAGALLLCRCTLFGVCFGVWASAAPYGTSPTCLNPVPSHTHSHLRISNPLPERATTSLGIHVRVLRFMAVSRLLGWQCGCCACRSWHACIVGYIRSWILSEKNRMTRAWRQHMQPWGQPPSAPAVAARSTVMSVAAPMSPHTAARIAADATFLCLVSCVSTPATPAR